jgi:hypothetical protein
MPIYSERAQELVSTLNSTTSTLAGDETFTGTWEENAYPQLFVMTDSDVEGTLFFDFSNDGVNSDSTYPVNGYYCGANIPEVHTAVKAGRYFRIRYVNGSSAQTHFRLTMRFGFYGNLAAALNQSIGLDADATVVRPTSVQDEISIGRRSGVTAWNKFAYREDVDSGDGDVLIIADNTTNDLTILATASTFDIAYDGTGGGSTDGSGTTGATQLTFYYLDENGEAAVSAHNLGTDGNDTTSFSGLGINRIAVSATGSNKANASDITITATTGGSVQAFVPAGQSVTQQAIFHCPTNARGCAKFLFIGANKLSGSSPIILFKGIVFNRTVETNYEIFRHTLDTDTDTSLTLVDPINFALSQGDVLYFTADTNVNNTAVECRFSLNTYQDA